MMVEALNMHVITVSWDLQYLTCLAESSRAKLKAIEVTEMNSGTTVSQPGNLFYDTLKVIQYAVIHTGAIIITGVRPKDKQALASKSRCRLFCYSFNICGVQCNSSLWGIWQIELTMHSAMLNH